jgi:Helix-turn-helix domain
MPSLALAAFFRTFRDALGVSQAVVSRAAHVPRSSIDKFENGWFEGARFRGRLFRAFGEILVGLDPRRYRSAARRVRVPPPCRSAARHAQQRRSRAPPGRAEAKRCAPR